MAASQAYQQMFVLPDNPCQRQTYFTPASVTKKKNVKFTPEFSFLPLRRGQVTREKFYV
jgi:hypothetical protein